MNVHVHRKENESQWESYRDKCVTSDSNLKNSIISSNYEKLLFQNDTLLRQCERRVSFF